MNPKQLLSRLKVYTIILYLGVYATLYATVRLSSLRSNSRTSITAWQPTLQSSISTMLLNSQVVAETCISSSASLCTMPQVIAETVVSTSASSLKDDIPIISCLSLAICPVKRIQHSYGYKLYYTPLSIGMTYSVHSRVQSAVLQTRRNQVRRSTFCAMIRSVEPICCFNTYVQYFHSLYPWQLNTSVQFHSDCIVGGGETVASKNRKKRWTLVELKPYVVLDTDKYKDTDTFVYSDYSSSITVEDHTIYANVPADILFLRLPVPMLKLILTMHGIDVTRRKIATAKLKYEYDTHNCTTCPIFYSKFKQVISKEELNAKRSQKANAKHAEVRKAELQKITKARSTDPEYKLRHAEYMRTIRSESKFPPTPPTDTLVSKIIQGFCKDTEPDNINEQGCTVCGLLYSIADLKPFDELDLDLSILSDSGDEMITREERKSSSDPIKRHAGPIRDFACDHICEGCVKSIRDEKLPRNSLANGLWIGKVPPELQDLSWMEKMMIARVNHNYCVVRFSMSGLVGLHKLKANAISFSVPMPKVYQCLPPTREELDEVIAFIYIGTVKPTKEDWVRTPFLVRHRKVKAALDWLKLNHTDYAGIEISQERLDSYKEDEPPVIVDWHKADMFTDREATAVTPHHEDDGGTEEGRCPFILHGITGRQLSELEKTNPQQVRGMAIQRFKSDGFILGIGHSNEPEGLYDNPQLYPQMFPWLFPYGHGGFGNPKSHTAVSDAVRKRWLLMYHDKRFQLDGSFSLIAFNHEQIKNSTTGGYLLAKRNDFDRIAQRLMNIDDSILNALIQRIQSDGMVKPQTEQERDCYQVLRDLDYVNARVQGSVTSKKYMRNEIWALISHLGAPSWYITLTPADVEHPIALYYADTKETFEPNLFRKKDERLRLIANNPVAGARFFKLMVELFFKHVLGVDKKGRGLYGKTSGYYGTVEQQGRLSLHLHMLVWIDGSLTPQGIREKILDPTSDFQQAMVTYLESVHQGEFLTGTAPEIEKKIPEYKTNEPVPAHIPPTQKLPESSPSPCKSECNQCEMCITRKTWWSKAKEVIDQILWLSNRHKCRKVITDPSGQKKIASGCIDNNGNCKARFPRETFKETIVDPETGYLNMKKGEPWMNCISPVVTYLFRCNTDVTSLLSGTAIKSVIAYVTDYITKTPLKTHVMFQAVKSAFMKNPDVLEADIPRVEKARRLIMKIVNSLTSRSEIGAPMAAMYLLGHKDHYTGHKFKTCYWYSYYKEMMRCWPSELVDDLPDKVVIHKANEETIGISPVMDYIYRPAIMEHVSLYDWIRRVEKATKKKSKQAKQQYLVHSIRNHRWIGRRVEFLVRWQLGDSTWETYQECKTLSALDEYLERTKIAHWRELPQQYLSSTDVDLEDITQYEAEHREEIEEDDDDRSTDWAAFQPIHPQSETHSVRLCASKDGVVPNFVGGSLPRKDAGSREEYCAVMLMLFKPWRTGKDLKADGYSWDTCFDRYAFSSRQTQLMNFFHIRYECNDARDDYSAQKKAGLLQAKLSMMLDDDLTNDGLTMDDFLNRDELQHTIDVIEQHNELDEPCLALARKRIDIAAYLRLLRGVGALNPLDQKEHISVTIENGDQHGSSVWKSLLGKLRENLLQTRLAQAAKKIATAPQKTTGSKDANSAKPVNKSYLTRKYEINDPGNATMLNDIVAKFTLNEEQERAFRIVANHAIQQTNDHLRMYLGGMAGTGKSQVIKALIELFTRRNEEYRFVCLAPTGTAAALIGGSTYHSTLKLGKWDSQDPEDEANKKKSSKIHFRLDHVDYIFIDEVSMLDCRALNLISAKLNEGMDKYDLSFGGKNVILAGDFAQLPPACTGYSLYAHGVRTTIHTTSSAKAQEESMGKFLWHTFTTVVILRQNMRQKSQTKMDAKFRTMLENLRYKSCTDDDIALLKSRVNSASPTHPKISDPRFRNVSVIVTRNYQRDQLNKSKTEMFAQDTGQKLETFYSVDHYKSSRSDNGDNTNRVQQRKVKNFSRQSNKMDLSMQERLWQLEPEFTHHYPSQLSICIGLPVMVKYNYATECGVTNGAEGVVVGWKSHSIGLGKEALSILFVKLTSPPTPIQLDGLEENVVPISAENVDIECKVNDGTKIPIRRTQVLALPNFGMTDFNSQGRTRKFNVCDISNCLTHQSIYTCLSRGSTYDGTMLLQGFDSKVVPLTGGLSGELRQEFRDLELLDEITKLIFEDKLPKGVFGLSRTALIHSYRSHKNVGKEHVPKGIHSALKWSAKDMYDIVEVGADDIKAFKYIHGDKKPPTSEDNKENEDESKKQPKKQQKTQQRQRKKVDTSRYVPAKGSQPLAKVNTEEIEDEAMAFISQMLMNAATISDSTSETTTLKRKRDTDPKPDLSEVSTDRPQKRMRQSKAIPLGFIWNDNSCAYDSVLVILYYSYLSCPKEWQSRIQQYTHLLGEFYSNLNQNSTALEVTRDNLRLMLNSIDPSRFPSDSSRGASALEVFSEMTQCIKPCFQVSKRCTQCGEETLQYSSQTVWDCGNSVWKNHPTKLRSSRNQSIQQWIKAFMTQKCRRACTCSGVRVQTYTLWSSPPPFLIFNVSEIEVKVTSRIKVFNHTYNLIGIIYYGGFHFTSRIIDRDSNIWYHDGMTTGRQCIQESNVKDIDSTELLKVKGKDIYAMVYSK